MHKRTNQCILHLSFLKECKDFQQHIFKILSLSLWLLYICIILGICEANTFLPFNQNKKTANTIRIFLRHWHVVRVCINPFAVGFYFSFYCIYSHNWIILKLFLYRFSYLNHISLYLFDKCSFLALIRLDSIGLTTDDAYLKSSNNFIKSLILGNLIIIDLMIYLSLYQVNI